MKKELFKEIALQAGGSHYPEVGGATLEKFAELLLERVIEVVQKTPIHCANTTYDLGIVECTIGKTVEAIEQTFGIPHNYEKEHENRTSIRPAFRVSGH
jgi:hypothetical protein